MNKLVAKAYGWLGRLKKQEGQTWMEYGMIIGGVILVIVFVIMVFGDKLMELFGDVSDSIEIREPSQGSW